MTKPFRWFNDLIERSALWYAVYVIILRIICGNFFYSLSDQAFYTFSIIFWTVITYVAFKFVLKKLEKYLRYYEQYNSSVAQPYNTFIHMMSDEIQQNRSTNENEHSAMLSSEDMFGYFT